MKPMTYFPLTGAQQRWRDVAQQLADEVLGPRAAETDRDGTFPTEQLAALRAAGLMGLRGDPTTAAPARGCSPHAWSPRRWPRRARQPRSSTRCTWRASR